jgi:hypothetical protein
MLSKSLLGGDTDSGRANTSVLLAQQGDSQPDGRKVRTKVDLQSEETIDDKERSNEHVRSRMPLKAANITLLAIKSISLLCRLSRSKFGLLE